jgi:large subunit ribosomal protein L5
MTSLKERYVKEIVPALVKEFKYENPMQVPALNKVVLNIGMGEATSNPKAMDAAVKDLTAIAGQKPVVKRAKESVANFKLRAGNPIGLMVTLRGQRMYQFVDKLCLISLPRQRDFQGISGDAFDGRGNYTLGLKEQLIFPEIEYDKVDKVRGLEISIVTTAKTDQEGKRLLQLIGMPFKAEGKG